MLPFEPFDIANYYKSTKNEDSKPYMNKGRPRRNKTPQKWLEDNDLNAQFQPPLMSIDQQTMLT